MQIGPRKDVVADRILFLFDDDSKCVYPAMPFDRTNLDAQRKIVQRMKDLHANADSTVDYLPYYLERDTQHIFDFKGNNMETYINYWVPLVDKQQNTVYGAVGLQLKQSDYLDLIPSSVMEQPYAVTFISVLDRDQKEVWTYSTDLDKEEEEYVIKQALPYIDAKEYVRNMDKDHEHVDPNLKRLLQTTSNTDSETPKQEGLNEEQETVLKDQGSFSAAFHVDGFHVDGFEIEQGVKKNNSQHIIDVDFETKMNNTDQKVPISHYKLDSNT